MGNANNRRQLWEARYKSGKCIYCGKKRFTKGTKGCKDCRQKKTDATARYDKNHPEKQKQYRKKIRFEVLQKYGGQCKCCGESRLEFLAIDHINKDGAVERRDLYGSNSGASHRWFLKLKRDNLRSDLQVLCHNCNMASYHFGVCPHERGKESS